MNGTASPKAVLPALVPTMSYENLEIADGGTASQLYLNCLKDVLFEEEQKKIFENLRIYCGQDTLAEVKLLKFCTGLCPINHLNCGTK